MDFIHGPLICNSSSPGAGCVVTIEGGVFGKFLQQCDEHKGYTIDQLYAEVLAQTLATEAASAALGVPQEEVDWSFDKERNVVVYSDEMKITSVAPVEWKEFISTRENPEALANYIEDAAAEAVVALRG